MPSFFIKTNFLVLSFRTNSQRSNSPGTPACTPFPSEHLATTASSPISVHRSNSRPSSRDSDAGFVHYPRLESPLDPSKLSTPDEEEEMSLHDALRPLLITSRMSKQPMRTNTLNFPGAYSTSAHSCPAISPSMTQALGGLGACCVGGCKHQQTAVCNIGSGSNVGPGVSTLLAGCSDASSSFCPVVNPASPSELRKEHIRQASHR